MSNRERANRLIDFARLDTPEDWRALKDAIAKALDEKDAEIRLLQETVEHLIDAAKDATTELLKRG